jgi:hypothetical protein
MEVTRKLNTYFLGFNHIQFYFYILYKYFHCFTVTERVLDFDEKPLDIIKNIGQESLRQMELMRFYLQLKQDPHGPNIALFVGNLPTNLSQRTYENILMTFLGEGTL